METTNDEDYPPLEVQRFVQQNQPQCNAAMFKVLDVMYVNDLVFWSCPECMCKVTSNFKADKPGNERFFCKRCQEYHNKPFVHAKYKLTLKVCDCSSRRIVQLTVFGSSIEQIIGCPPSDYQRYQTEMREELTERQIKDSLLRILLGKIITVQITDKNWARTDRPVFKGQNLTFNEPSDGGSLVDQLKNANSTWKKETDSDKLSNAGISTELKGNLTLPEGAQVQAVKFMDENCDANKPIVETWQDSLIEEFNQSLVIEANEQPLTFPCKNAGKRLRSELSLNNTPSAPVKTKPRINFPEEVFASPLLLPNDFHTPVKQTVKNSISQTPCSSLHMPILVTSTPHQASSQLTALSQSMAVDLSKDLFSETEDTS